MFFYVIDSEFLKKYKQLGFMIIDPHDFNNVKNYPDGNSVHVTYELGKYFVGSTLGYGVSVDNVVDAQDYFFNFQHKIKGQLDYFNRRF